MRKKFVFFIPLFIALLIVLISVFLLRQRAGKGALQVTSLPKSNVYLNDKLIGQTPLCKCESSDIIESGEYLIRLVPIDTSFSPFEEKISISQSLLTVVERTFGLGALSSGSIITLTPSDDTKNAQLLVVSFPSESQLFLDRNPVAKTPALLKSVTESDHEIKLSKDGYTDKTIRIHGVVGYKVTAEIFLGINPDLSAQTASTSAPLSGATPSAELNLSPTVAVQKVIIQSSVGYANVRDTNSVSGKLIQTVNAGDIYELLDEKDGWYQIKLDVTGKSGWISSSYAQKE